MRNIALELTYLGTAYHGWQIQKKLATVEQTLENAAGAVVGHPVHMTGCGRTDAGVHARHYIANFRTTSTIPCDRLPYALNTKLPPDIVVVRVMEVHEGFNAIGSCVKKEYTYYIYNSNIRDPFYVDRAWFYPRHLDEGIMARAAAQFVGTHDFSAVRSCTIWPGPWPVRWYMRRRGNSPRRKSGRFSAPAIAPPPVRRFPRGACI